MGFCSPSISLTCLSTFEQKTLYTQNAPFHVVITSYQLVVQDVKYFQRVKWQYMVLDEAQALKSSSRYHSQPGCRLILRKHTPGCFSDVFIWV